MVDLQTALTGNREAISAFLSAARAVPSSRWAEPRAPGKWSSAEITEHVALSYEVSRGILQGSFKGTRVPRLFRPLIGTFFLQPVLQRGEFGRPAKAPKPLRPTGTHTGLEALTSRLQASADSFEAYVATAARAGKTSVDHPLFGRLPLDEFLRLQTIHTHHHRKQLPSAGN